MQISVTDPVLQTSLFVALLTLAVVLTVKRRAVSSALDITFTNELRGVAILMVIFSHVGYFLFSDHRFMYPLSVAGGKGVDIFLLLSGFGLTASALKSRMILKDFYIKRLKKIYIPMWVVLGIFLVLDLLILSRHYSLRTIVYNLLGWFPRADVGLDVDSPLWYFTIILFYYLVFPIFFSGRWPLLSAILILILGRFVIGLNLPMVTDVAKLYKLHYMAFPLGMCLAILSGRRGGFRSILVAGPRPAARDFFEQLRNPPRAATLFAKLIAIITALYLFGFLSINSGVGEGNPLKEQLVSLAALGCLLFVFFLKRVCSRFLTLLGIYSYEIYLIHWPIMYRYDFLYHRLPASLATFLYLVIFVALGAVLKALTGRLYEISSSRTKN